MDEATRIADLKRALAPLVKIAYEYDKDGLDQARPCWVSEGICSFDMDEELFAGRGGKRLLTLGDCIRAREVVTGVAFVPPGASDLVRRVKKAHDAMNVGGPTWDGMSEERRSEFVKKFEAWEKENPR